MTDHRDPVTDGALRADRPRGADRVRSHELAIVLRTTGRRARQVWLGCKRCALSGTDHRDPRTEEGCPVTETRTGLPAAVSSGYPDRIAGGYFVRVAGQDCRRQFRSGYTMTVQRLARSRPNGGRAHLSRAMARSDPSSVSGRTLAVQNHSVAKGRRDRLSQRPLSSPPQLWRSALRVSSVRHPR